ncbi:TPA: hypothetical protein EYP45_00215 [Candidatus Peregrinibacteria bacterium]|nr:hypothetical protein [Candidatus Peregrinibacteria bacterium]
MSETEVKPKKVKRFVPNIKKVSQNPQPLANGHRLCPGCSESLILKQALSTIDVPVITANATGCSEICFGAYPYTSFKTPWIHSLFENAASVISGIEAMHKAKLKRGELSEKKREALYPLIIENSKYLYTPKLLHLRHILCYVLYLRLYLCTTINKEE